MKEEKEIVSVIDDLIQTLKDGQEGFKQAAEGVKAPQLKSLFNEYSSQRLQFATELQSQAHSLGRSHPEESGSPPMPPGRNWLKKRPMITIAPARNQLIRMPCMRKRICQRTVASTSTTL